MQVGSEMASIQPPNRGLKFIKTRLIFQEKGFSDGTSYSPRRWHPVWHLPGKQ
jgi:hypothetical protein